MFTVLPRRAARAALGLGVAAALVPAGLAHAATDTSSVVVTGAGAVILTTPPTFGNFPGVTLTGDDQAVSAAVTNWTVTDATGTAPGWQVNTSADVPHNVGSTVEMTGAALALTAPTASTIGINASTAPVVAGSADIIGGGVNAARSVASTGAGVWNMAQGAGQLTLTIPADAKAASYSTTITTTLSAAI